MAPENDILKVRGSLLQLAGHLVWVYLKEIAGIYVLLQFYLCNVQMSPGSSQMSGKLSTPEPHL